MGPLKSWPAGHAIMTLSRRPLVERMVNRYLPRQAARIYGAVLVQAGRAVKERHRGLRHSPVPFLVDLTRKTRERRVREPGRRPAAQAGRLALESGARQPGISQVSDLPSPICASTRHHGPPTIRLVSRGPQPVMIELAKWHCP